MRLPFYIVKKNCLLLFFFLSPFSLSTPKCYCLFGRLQQTKCLDCTDYNRKWKGYFFAKYTTVPLNAVSDYILHYKDIFFISFTGENCIVREITGYSFQLLMYIIQGR